MHLTKWALVVMIGAALASDRIPAALADYRSWTKLTPKPKLVGPELSAMCAPAMDLHGPHGSRWVLVYANPVAARALEKDAKDFPAGSVIAKEKLVQRADKVPEAVAFMIKHGKGKFAESGGWEFAFYPSDSSSESLRHCVSCHRLGAEKDYVFSGLTKRR